MQHRQQGFSKREETKKKNEMALDKHLKAYTMNIFDLLSINVHFVI